MKLRSAIFTLALFSLLGLAPISQQQGVKLTAQQTLQRVIDALPRTSGVNGVPLGGDVQLSEGIIDLKGVPLKLYSGVRLVGHGTATVILGDIELATYTDPTNRYLSNATLEGVQLHGDVKRGTTANGEIQKLQFRDVEFWGSTVDLTGTLVYRTTFTGCAWHDWKASCVKGNLRVATFQDCKFQSDNIDAVPYPLIDLAGESQMVELNGCIFQPRGTWMRIVGNGCDVKFTNCWNEPLPPKAEQGNQRTVMPQFIMSGIGSELIADRLGGQNVQPFVFQNGASVRCPKLRATDTHGAELDVSAAFISSNQ